MRLMGPEPKAMRLLSFVPSLAGAAAIIALPSHANAQDIARSTQASPDEAHGSEGLAAERGIDDCEAAAAQTAPEPEEVVLPTTGAIFTLPPVRNDPVGSPDTDATEDKTPCADLPPPLPPRPAAPDIFGLAALPIGETATLARWNAVRAPSLDGIEGPWTELVDQIPDLPHLDPLDLVNRWVNWHVRYIDDSGGDDWSAPAPTMLRGFGDCEDFSIAKMALLRAVGIPDDEMFLVLLRDRHRRIDHAVLAVRREGRTWILDNRTDKLLSQEQVADYAPTMSFSGPYMWIYGQRSAQNSPASDRR